MKVTAELIERFFKKQCTSEEAKEVAAFLKANQELLDEYLTEKEWTDAETTASLSDKFWDEIWRSIQNKNKISAKIIWIKRSAVAACVAGLLAFTFYITTNKGERSIAENRKINTENPGILTQEVQHKTVKNTTQKTMHLLLQDSSDVVLSAGALIKYNVPFAGNKREIFLEGEAVFKVAKDKSKPFTVYAGGLATTALGTKFKITANKAQKKTTVKLFEGRVVIRSADADLEGWSKNVYLNAGEQMEYASNRNTVTVSAIPATLPENNIAAIKTDKAAKNVLSFTGTPLPDVIDKLSIYFNHKIIYEKDEVDSMSFTGTITKSDSLEIVLKVIAQMNDLTIEQQDDQFIIHKISP